MVAEAKVIAGFEALEEINVLNLLFQPAAGTNACALKVKLRSVAFGEMGIGLPHRE